jgi:hypothetical protein
VSYQGSVDGAEGGVGCLLSVVGRLSKLDNDAAFSGRADLLPPLGLSRNDGFHAESSFSAGLAGAGFAAVAAGPVGNKRC